MASVDPLAEIIRKIQIAQDDGTMTEAQAELLRMELVATLRAKVISSSESRERNSGGSNNSDSCGIGINEPRGIMAVIQRPQEERRKECIRVYYDRQHDHIGDAPPPPIALSQERHRQSKKMVPLAGQPTKSPSACNAYQSIFSANNALLRGGLLSVETKGSRFPRIPISPRYEVSSNNNNSNNPIPARPPIPRSYAAAISAPPRTFNSKIREVIWHSAYVEQTKPRSLPKLEDRFRRTYGDNIII